MPASWIIIVSAISLVGIYFFIFNTSLKITSRRQKELLQIQADKIGGQVNEHLMLVLPMVDFRILITPDLYASEDNYKTVATLGWNGSDLSEQVSHFPKIAVFKKKILSGKSNSEWNQEESQVWKRQKKFLLGNKDFDKVFSTYAESEADAHRVLTDEVQQGLLRLASKSPRVRTDEMRFLATSQMIRDIVTYDIFINTAISISEKLTGTVYKPKQATEHAVSGSDTASENLASVSYENREENSMGFLKNLFGKKDEPKGEPFVPTPTQSIPGLEPIIVQAIENLFPNAEDQKKAFAYALEYTSKHRGGTCTLLAIFFDSKGKIESLYSPTLWSDGRFNLDMADTFKKMKDAEAWVKSITKM